MKNLQRFFCCTVLCALLNLFNQAVAQTSYSQLAKLVASDGAQREDFGISVAMSADGNTAVVGASQDNIGGIVPGSAYIYVRNGGSWIQQAKLIASDGADSDQFGFSVSISADGNTVIIGAYYEDAAGSTRGAAYIFTRIATVWTQQAKLIASDGADSDLFGCSVSMSADGNTVVIGANFDDVTASDQGSAYIFNRSGTVWTQLTKLVASDAANSDYYGSSVAISGDGNTIVVGAKGKDETQPDQGVVYIYIRTGTSWNQQAKLLAGDPGSSDSFGNAVAISNDGNTIIVGTESDDITFSNQGSAYIFTRSGTAWSQQSKLIAGDGALNDFHSFRQIDCNTNSYRYSYCGFSIC